MAPGRLALTAAAAAAAALTDMGLDPAALQAGPKAGVAPRELARAIADKLGEDTAIGSVEVADLRSVGVALMFEEIRASLADFGVRFDVYVNETELRSRGSLDAALARLRRAGHVYFANGLGLLGVTAPDRL